MNGLTRRKWSNDASTSITFNIVILNDIEAGSPSGVSVTDSVIDPVYVRSNRRLHSSSTFNNQNLRALYPTITYPSPCALVRPRSAPTHYRPSEPPAGWHDQDWLLILVALDWYAREGDITDSQELRAYHLVESIALCEQDMMLTLALRIPR